jgi:transposase
MVHSTVEDVRIKEQTSYDRVLGVMERQIEAETDWSRYTEIGRLGLDEIALKKGHKDYVTIITAYVDDQLILLGVLKDRKKETVKKFFRSIPNRLRKTVKFICSDLCPMFISAAREVFGKRVQICADRFHVAKLYREKFEELRRKEIKRLKESLPKKDQDSLKNIHWLLRKSYDELTSDERRRLNWLWSHSPKLKQAYRLQEELTVIYNSDISKGDAKRKFKYWIRCARKSGVGCYDRFINTLESHMEEMTNYFTERKNSGFVEGFNNKIKVLKRRAYGITNLTRLYQRLCLDLHGFSWFLFKENEETVTYI